MGDDPARRLMRGSTPRPERAGARRPAAEAAFLRDHPSYGDTRALDELRASGFARLDAGGHVYLDYTGAGLYADSQLSEHLELLQRNVTAQLLTLLHQICRTARGRGWRRCGLLGKT